MGEFADDVIESGYAQWLDESGPYEMDLLSGMGSLLPTPSTQQKLMRSIIRENTETHHRRILKEWNKEDSIIERETKSNTYMSTQQEEKKSAINEPTRFYAKVAVVGPSGTGKSYLAKTADPDTCGIVNIERKPMSFRQEKPFKYIGQPKTWAGFKKNIEDYGNNPEIKTIIIDSQTMAFNILNKEMGQNFSGYDIYKNYNRQVYEYLELIKNINKDIIVLSHDELIKLDDTGDKVKRMDTHGKEFAGKIEQHFAVVLYTGTRMKEGKPQYYLKTFEADTSTKVPEYMFSPDCKSDSPLEIPNDAKYIFNAVEKYYTI